MKTTPHKPSPSMGRNHGKLQPPHILMLATLVFGAIMFCMIAWRSNKEPHLGRVYQIEKVDHNGFTAKTVDLPGQSYEFKSHRTTFDRKSDIDLIKTFSKDLQPGRYCFFWSEGSGPAITLATTADLKIAEAWAKGGPGPSGTNFPEFYRWLENPIEYNRAHEK